MSPDPNYGQHSAHTVDARRSRGERRTVQKHTIGVLEIAYDERRHDRFRIADCVCPVPGAAEKCALS